MSDAPKLSEDIALPEEIIHAGLDAELVLFIGSGISILAGYPSWDEFANKVLDELREKGIINFLGIKQLSALDPRKKLSIAQQKADSCGYDLDFAKRFTGKSESDTIYKLINDIGCPCITTNYDELLAPCFLENKDGSTTESLTRVSESEKFHEELARQPGTVVHLHGSVSKPETMIVTTDDYLKHYDSQKVQNLLVSLFKKHTVLFLGYGLEEAEILEHILRKGSAEKIKNRRKIFALQGFFGNEQYLYENLYNYYKESFGVHLLGFLRDNENHECQVGIIKEWMHTLEIGKPTLSNKYQSMIEILKDG